MRGHVHVEGTDEFKQTRNRICPKTSHRVSLVEARMSLIVSGRSRVGVCVGGGGVSSTRRKRRGEPAGTERSLPSRRPQRPAPRGALLLSSGETRDRALLRTKEGRRGCKSPPLLPSLPYIPLSPSPHLRACFPWDWGGGRRDRTRCVCGRVVGL